MENCFIQGQEPRHPSADTKITYLKSHLWHVWSQFTGHNAERNAQEKILEMSKWSGKGWNQPQIQHTGPGESSLGKMHPA